MHVKRWFSTYLQNGPPQRLQTFTLDLGMSDAECTLPGRKSKGKEYLGKCLAVSTHPNKMRLEMAWTNESQLNHHSLERQQITFQSIKSPPQKSSPFGMANIWYPKAASHSLPQNDHLWTSPRHVIRVDNMCDLSSWRMLRWRNAFWDTLWQPTVAAENCQLYWEKLLYNFTNHLWKDHVMLD